MPHALVSRLLPCSLVLFAALGCPADPEGDDLPPGAFTSGADDVIDPSDSDTATTSVDPTSTTTTEPPPDTSTGDTAEMLSHAAHIQPIWDANCTGGSCHDSSTPASGLDLQSAGVYERLCMNSSTTQTSIRLVDCDGLDPEASWMWSKLTGEGLELPGAGTLMPLGSMLSPGDIANVEAWIANGALP